MKTMNSKLRKAGLETLTVLVIVFTACFTLSAQGANFEKRLRGHDELALNKTDKSELRENLKTNVLADLPNFESYLNVKKEEELVIENWMTDAVVFQATELENENQLKVENWMINEMLFLATFDEKNQEETTAKPASRPKVVGFTFPEAQFGRRTFIHLEAEDPKLELERWMVDDELWKIRRK